MSEDSRQGLKKRLDQQSERLKRAQREQDSLLGQTVYLGTIGLLFVMPIVAGGYLGSWLDDMASGYSSRWTTSLLFAGVMLGAFNVYLFIRERT